MKKHTAKKVVKAVKPRKMNLAVLLGFTLGSAVNRPTFGRNAAEIMYAN